MRPVKELGGADVHTSKSGVADHFAENEPEAGALGDPGRVRSCSVTEENSSHSLGPGEG